MDVVSEMKSCDIWMGAWPAAAKVPEQCYIGYGGDNKSEYDSFSIVSLEHCFCKV